MGQIRPRREAGLVVLAQAKSSSLFWAWKANTGLLRLVLSIWWVQIKVNLIEQVYCSPGVRG